MMAVFQKDPRPKQYNSSLKLAGFVGSGVKISLNGGGVGEMESFNLAKLQALQSTR